MNKLCKSLCLPLLICWTGCLAIASDTPPANLIGREEVLASSKRFLRACNLALPQTGSPRILLRNTVDGLWRWQVSWQEPGWGGPYQFLIDARSGQVLSFHNYAREYEQVKGINRTGRRFYRSLKEAEDYLKRIAEAIGVPEGAVCKGVEVVEDSQPARTDANASGHLSISYVQRPFGYPFLTAHGKEGAALIVAADPQDGTVTFVGRAVPRVVESHTRRFEKHRAVEKAKQVYAAHYRNRRGAAFHRGTYTGKVELGYVYPNGAFGGKRYPPQVPYRARLAYAVYFGQEAVWIDAADGSVLGGILLK